MNERFQLLRLLEALIFASAEPLGRDDLARHLPEGSDLDALLEELAALYANRGVTLVQVGKRWAFRTATDLAPLMKIETHVKRRLSRAAMETLAIVAYHQPVTRAEIEEIRGVGLSRGTLDTLLEAGWVKPRGRRRAPGRPVTWGTTESFLDHFGLDSLDSLPGRDELKAAGLLDTRPAIAALGEQGGLPGADENGEGEDEADEEEMPLPEDFEVSLELPDGEEAPDSDEAEEGADSRSSADGAEASGPPAESSTRQAPEAAPETPDAGEEADVVSRQA